MALNRLRLNVGETECMWFAKARRQHLIDHSPIDQLISMVPSSSVRDLGVLLSSDISMTIHVNTVTPMNIHVNTVVSEFFYKR